MLQRRYGRARRKKLSPLGMIATGQLPLVLMQFPSGRWGFTGHIPASLSYIRKDGSPPTAHDLDVARHAGPGFANLSTRTWASSEEALAAARAEGHEPTQILGNK